MADLQPPEGPATTGTTATVTANATTTATTTTAPAVIAPVLTENNENNSNNYVGPGLAPKRQRRPSVRLGEIGEPPATHTLSYEPQARRPKTWRFHKDPSLATKISKTRPLTNLVNGGADPHETLDTNEDVINNNINNNNLDFGIRKPKSKKPAKRIRTNWSGVEGDSREENDELRDFEQEEGSESPLKEQSPVHSIDNVGLDSWHRRRRRPVRAWVSESRDRDHDNGMPESNSRDRNFGGFGEREGTGLLDEGVRDWLIGLGLGRYAPVFEIHEVDEEVLPMLTLEDLKDMGINAVGSRRKMYSAILKLRKGFS